MNYRRSVEEVDPAGGLGKKVEPAPPELPDPAELFEKIDWSRNSPWAELLKRAYQEALKKHAG